MEAVASVAPGLCLGALSKVPTEIYKFLIEVPFAKEESPCPFKYEISGLKMVITKLFCKLEALSHQGGDYCIFGHNGHGQQLFQES